MKVNDFEVKLKLLNIEDDKVYIRTKEFIDIAIKLSQESSSSFSSCMSTIIFAMSYEPTHKTNYKLMSLWNRVKYVIKIIINKERIYKNVR